ncbi:SSU ribosomal protein S4P [Candidatus Kryptonium thompsonii]|uniref:Small ribosomal subunit protein uS4 n=1 Tax=Candidatus Kryptonium thompsonii TaxID=1633631 RepID=A0A0P1LNV9_9BACT|nr:30S ribosomal protein S4 [Candidatus Kryptonium thompsoni]CUS76601.1 SSU ribosomal protein S4P [Candidatus Kryptonium thompsoni]CUS78231.1 SSU ribosomal protein S4P [Candidatus Kryptonium thompsoni]CUS81613.1 SSU ribosomal protein S4P [Candidatus Kryptonium thompsoni]CUS83517.1 SSU ribosomal protein S4P [Candidatus Kryptonium thompsoni]CUS90914.1 SSU ribosomal protein S4P [Candidatus Kryptonium thompsoni]
MGRYTGPVCRLCRRERVKLYLKGEKCYTEKCPLEKKNYPPGQHGPLRRARLSEYGIQLREKQKLRRIYGVLERQFRRYFEMATRQKGKTGENLIKILERRLDNVVYRLGFAPSRKAARQLVKHRHILVNNKIVDIPSYLVEPGDEIRVRDKSKELEIIHNSLKRVTETSLVPWLQLNKATLSGVFMYIPERSEIPINVNEQLIVELYSK